jgi:hypothetical protein
MKLEYLILRIIGNFTIRMDIKQAILTGTQFK